VGGGRLCEAAEGIVVSARRADHKMQAVFLFGSGLAPAPGRARMQTTALSCLGTELELGCGGKR
jgi:hypothetical protein